MAGNDSSVSRLAPEGTGWSAFMVILERTMLPQMPCGNLQVLWLMMLNLVLFFTYTTVKITGIELCWGVTEPSWGGDIIKIITDAISIANLESSFIISLDSDFSSSNLITSSTLMHTLTEKTLGSILQIWFTMLV